MGKLWQVLGNVVLYGFLLWLLYDSTSRSGIHGSRRWWRSCWCSAS